MTFISSEVESTYANANATAAAAAAAAEATRLGNTFAIAEESLRQLWALNDDGASESSLGADIHLIGSNGGSPGFKSFFRQKFDPKESTIAAFITIYKVAMRRATNKLERDYILSCLDATKQEVTIPELFTIQTWAQMQELLIVEFGGELSLEVKKN